MAKIDHPFVCKLHNTFQDDACIYMLLSFIQGGELLNLIQGGKDCGGLPESAAKFFAAGILEGLSYMHRRHIVYRDLKPENVMLDKDEYAVIVDFGFCEFDYCFPCSMGLQIHALHLRSNHFHFVHGPGLTFLPTHLIFFT